MAKHLLSLPAHQRHDVRVRIAPDMEPLAWPHNEGTVFLAKGAAAWVIWDGEKKPTMTSARALRLV
jgi:hypothetical protein